MGYAKSGSRWALIGTSASGNWHQIFYDEAQYWYYAKGRAQTLEYVAPEAPVSVVVEEAVRITVPTLAVHSGSPSPRSGGSAVTPKQMTCAGHQRLAAAEARPDVDQALEDA